MNKWILEYAQNIVFKETSAGMCTWENSGGPERETMESFIIVRQPLEGFWVVK